MREHNNQDQDTPPSSLHGDDEIQGMEGEEGFYLDEMEELPSDFEFEEEEDQEMQEDIEMEPPEDLAALTFDKHSASVFCCDLHPSGKIAVTGGEDDIAFVWSVETGQVIMECKGHKDSVVYVGFSFDGAYLATADLGGLIKVWKVNEGDSKDPWPIVFEYEAADLSWGLWHFGAKVLVFGIETGDIFVFKVPSGETKVLQGHNVKVECGKLFHDGVRLAAGYEDGSIKIWDLKTSSAVHHIPPGPHQTKVTAIDTHPENSLVASISSDGKVVLTAAANGKVVGQLEADTDLEAVAFVPDPQLGYFALGTLNGAVSIWDSARQMVRHNCARPADDASAGVTKMIWVKDRLVTGCLDGALRVYDGRSGDKNLTLTGHRSEVLDLVYNEKQNIFLTTSDDGTARIFKYEINKDKD